MGVCNDALSAPGATMTDTKKQDDDALSTDALDGDWDMPEPASSTPAPAASGSTPKVNEKRPTSPAQRSQEPAKPQISGSTPLANRSTAQSGPKRASDWPVLKPRQSAEQTLLGIPAPRVPGQPAQTSPKRAKQTLLGIQPPSLPPEPAATSREPSPRPPSVAPRPSTPPRPSSAPLPASAPPPASATEPSTVSAPSPPEEQPALAVEPAPSPVRAPIAEPIVPDELQSQKAEPTLTAESHALDVAPAAPVVSAQAAPAIQTAAAAVSSAPTVDKTPSLDLDDADIFKPRFRRRGLLAALAIGLVLGAGGLLWALGSNRKESRPVEPMTPPVVAKPIESAPPVKPQQPATAPEVQAPPPAPTTKTVEIKVIPSKARIYQKGKLVGTGTMSIDLASGEKQTFDIGLTGYKSRRVTVDDTKPERTFRLTAEEEVQAETPE